MNIESYIAEYIKNQGIKLSFLSDATGIQYELLRRSLKNDRKLRADEFIKICNVLKINPLVFE